MDYSQFLDTIIADGIVAATADYKDDPLRLKGSVAGFEACRGKTPEQLAALLAESGRKMTEAHMHEVENYWEVASYWAEVEWTCNCVSAILQNQGLRVIVPPTCRGVLKASEVVGVVGV